MITACHWWSHNKWNAQSFFDISQVLSVPSSLLRVSLLLCVYVSSCFCIFLCTCVLYLHFYLYSQFPLCIFFFSLCLFSFLQYFPWFAEDHFVNFTLVSEAGQNCQDNYSTHFYCFLSPVSSRWMVTDGVSISSCRPLAVRYCCSLATNLKQIFIWTK